jgi:hypothetical protein
VNLELEERKLEIGGEEYIVREITWSEKNEISGQCFEYDPVTRRGKMDTIKFNELLLLKALKKAPFEVTIEKIRSLPARAGDILFAVAQDLNVVTESQRVAFLKS